MPFETIITCHEAASHLDTPDWVFVDCRTSMAEREKDHHPLELLRLLPLF